MSGERRRCRSSTSLRKPVLIQFPCDKAEIFPRYIEAPDRAVSSQRMAPAAGPNGIPHTTSATTAEAEATAILRARSRRLLRDTGRKVIANQMYTPSAPPAVPDRIQAAGCEWAAEFVISPMRPAAKPPTSGKATMTANGGMRDARGFGYFRFRLRGPRTALAGADPRSNVATERHKAMTPSLVVWA